MLPLVSIRVFISFLLYEDIVERDLDASLELRESILSLPRSISSLSLDRTNISLQKKIFLKSDGITWVSTWLSQTSKINLYYHYFCCTMRALALSFVASDTWIKNIKNLHRWYIHYFFSLQIDKIITWSKFR